MKVSRVLICGDRNWTDQEAISNQLKMIGPENIQVVIEGECQGADQLGRNAAEALGIEVLRFPADWERWGKAAGPRRNAQMLLTGQPTLVLAFHDDLKSSKGTQNMINQAKRAGVRVKVVRHSPRALERSNIPIYPIPQGVADNPSSETQET